MEFPQTLRSRRLLLTRIAPSDLDDFHRMRTDARVTQALGAVAPQRIAVLLHCLVEHWKQHGFGWWTVRDADGTAFMGCGGLRCTALQGSPQTEVAYGLLPEYWGRGYASELVRVAIAQGFVRLGARDIASFVLPGNIASRRVAEKAGFRHTAEVIHAARPHLLYRLTVEDWCTPPQIRRPSESPARALLQTA